MARGSLEVAMRKCVLLCTGRVAWGELLERSLGAMAGVGTVRYCPTGREVLRRLRETRADVVLLDPGAAVENMFDVAGAVRRASARTAVVFFAESTCVGWVTRAVKAGASGFLGPCATLAEFSRTIRVVRRGLNYFSPAAARIVAELASGRASFPVLTGREASVLGRLCEGRSTKEIAQRLGLGPKTIESFRARLMQKTGTRRATELVRYACLERFVDLVPPCGAMAAPHGGSLQSREN